MFVSLVACSAEVPVQASEDDGATAGASIDLTPDLSGCHGHASSTIPADGRYVVTTFGGPGDGQQMSCGGYADGVSWYAASRQRYGCGARLQVSASNGNCVVVAARDYGPDVCVENAAHMPILDMSPRATKALFGISGAGWSDHIVVTVAEVDASTPLGTCVTSTPAPAAAACPSTTLDRDVSDGACVQDAGDASWYQCTNGTWTTIASTSGCSESYAWCNSATLGRAVPPRTCVQSASTSAWYQCNGQAWVRPVDVASETGPIGACASWNAL